MRALILLIACLEVACGSVPAATSSSTPTAIPTTAATTIPATTTAASTAQNASPTVASGTVTIEMAEHFYSPSLITVKVGTTVVWKVVGVQSHDVHARDGSFNSPLLAPGNTFTFTFTKAGKFPYYCAPHEGDGMFGEVDVVAN